MWDEGTGELLDGGANDGGGAQLASVPSVDVGVIAPVRDGGDGNMLVTMMRVAQSALTRDPATLIASAKRIGGLLGSSGFYRFPAGGSTVQGPSIDMAQALAQEWGGFIYQVRIVNAEPMASGGQRVHLRASVADMKSLVCAEVDQVVNTAPPPGKFAEKPEQRERWNGMQVQSAASKIVRNAILRVLPAWYVDPAFDAAQEVDSKRALMGKMLPEARKGASDALIALGCALPDLETYIGHPIDLWAVPQISALRELYADLKAGRQSVEAWRASLEDKKPSNGASRNKLGLPTTTTNPVDEEALKASKSKKGEQAELPTK